MHNTACYKKSIIEMNLEASLWNGTRHTKSGLGSVGTSLTGCATHRDNFKCHKILLNILR